MAESVEEYRTRARAWLSANAKRRKSGDLGAGKGTGNESVALFRNLSLVEERELIDSRRRWIQRKADAGFANAAWDPEWGGLGLTREHDDAYEEEESEFEVPVSHESVGITCGIIAPTVNACGTQSQKQRFLRKMLRAEQMWCQLFSEPDAGSDLSGVKTRAVRDGDVWCLTGQKVWTSGAQHAEWGYALCRSDPAAPQRQGLTAFLVPMDAPGVEIKPLRQMTGGSSFNEVFLDGVRVPDTNRLGPVAGGWGVAMTTLGFERSGSGRDDSAFRLRRLIELALRTGKTKDHEVRQRLARAYIHQKLLELTFARVRSQQFQRKGVSPEGSIGKLLATEGLAVYNEAASAILGMALTADSGQWGTFAWAEHLLGSPGWRLAGGTDEIQRNIIADRVLGLGTSARAPSAEHDHKS